MNPAAADYSLTRNYVEWLAVLAVGEDEFGRGGHSEGEGVPGRGSLRAEEGEGPDSGLPFGAAVEARYEGPDPLLCRASGRG